MGLGALTAFWARVSARYCRQVLVAQGPRREKEVRCGGGHGRHTSQEIVLESSGQPVRWPAEEEYVCSEGDFDAFWGLPGHPFPARLRSEGLTKQASFPQGVPFPTVLQSWPPALTWPHSLRIRPRVLRRDRRAVRNGKGKLSQPDERGAALCTAQ